MFERYHSLTSEEVIQPIKINSLLLCTDSTCCLHWLESYAYKFDKLNDKSTFVKNKLSQIDELCSKKAVKFVHIKGEQNPADATTRPYSYKVLKKNKFPFLKGPRRLDLADKCDYITDRVITLPNPEVLPVDEVQGTWACITDASETKEQGGLSDWRACVNEVILPIDVGKCPMFFKAVSQLKYVLLFLNKLNLKVRGKRLNCLRQNSSLHRQAKLMILRTEQRSYFQSELNFLSNKRPIKDIPPLIVKVNLFVDNEGILKLKNKMGKFGNVGTRIIMHKKSIVTESIINQLHVVYNHCGPHQLVNVLKSEFYVNGIFSLVKKLLKLCIVCRRFNARPVKINQSDYRNERVNPEKHPFANIYLDYAGPFIVTLSGSKSKVWLLILTCMWTRAVNIIVCRTADTADFIQALQTHIYSYGIFKSCISDLGSQIRAGANTIQLYLSDSDTQNFIESHNIQWMQFRQFAKGNSALGSLVEVCVKQVKLLIHKTVKRAVLDYFHFEQLIQKINSLINKRPIAFKSELSTLKHYEVPEPITPEMLIKGYETKMMDIVPAQETFEDYRGDDLEDYSPNIDSINTAYTNLRAAKGRLREAYHHEFLGSLISQAVDKKDRYKPVKHDQLKVGDIVLIIEPNMKRLVYPMGKIEKIEKNYLGETTSAWIFKGSTRETVYRHVNSIILLLSRGIDQGEVNKNETQEHVCHSKGVAGRPQRKAAVNCREKLRSYVES